MAYAVDSDFAVDVKAAAGPPRRITRGFNAGLFAAVAAIGVARFLLASPAVVYSSPAAIASSCLLDIARFFVVVLVLAGFLKAFWERLVATIWPVRAITFDEAFATILMLSLLTET